MYENVGVSVAVYISIIKLAVPISRSIFHFFTKYGIYKRYTRISVTATGRVKYAYLSAGFIFCQMQYRLYVFRPRS